MIIKHPFLQLFLQFINASKTGRRLQVNGTRLKSQTITNYRMAYSLLDSFIKNQRFELFIYEIKGNNKREQKFLKSYWSKFYFAFTSYLYNDKKCHDNYVGHTIKKVRVFFSWLNKERFVQTGNYYKNFHVYHEDIAITTLSEERIKFLLFNAEFEASLTKTQKLAKDIFLFGFAAALRFSDVIVLTIANIEKRKDSWYLNTKAKKTGISVFVKLPDYALTIINRNQGNKKLFPDISLAYFNKCLKKLGELANWNEPIVKTRSKRGTGEVVFWQTPFHQSMSSHMMRRTSITCMLMAAIPEYVVRKISGHSDTSKSFHRYVNFAQTMLDTEIKKLHERLEHI